MLSGGQREWVEGGIETDWSVDTEQQLAAKCSAVLVPSMVTLMTLLCMCVSF